MVPKILMGRPVLVAGALMMAVFLMTYSGPFSLWERADRLRPVSCRAVRVRLDRRIPPNWSSRCRDNGLVVEIDRTGDGGAAVPEGSLERALFRELANSLKRLALASPQDNLENTDTVVVRLRHPDLVINAHTEGRHLARLRAMEDPGMIAEHLRETVRVQSVPAGPRE